MSSALVSIWLNNLAASSTKLLPLWLPDYDALCTLIKITPEKIIPGEDGDPRIVIINREKAIAMLKNQYRFTTKKEAAEQLLEAAKEK